MVRVLPLAKTTSSRPSPGTMVPPVMVEAPPTAVPYRMPPVATVSVLPAAKVSVVPLVLVATLRRELIVCVLQPEPVLVSPRLMLSATA